MDDPRRRLAALETWKVYRRWAAASAAMKRGRERWKRVVFWLGIVGIILGPIAAERGSVGSQAIARWVALVSGVAVALATYLSNAVLGPTPDAAWVRARQGAEGLKSLAFTFLMRAPPFGAADEADALDTERTRIEEALASEASLVALPIPDAEAEKNFPPSPLDTEAYVAARAREQQRWFETRVVENHRVAGRLELATKLLGAGAAVLAVFTAWFAGLAGWIVVVTAVAGALGAQATAGRFRFLEKSYHDTAARLARIVNRWEVSPRSADDDRRLVGDCERALRDENAGWVETMLKKDAPAAGAVRGEVAASPAPASGKT
jgi:hypothetical protein